jgi:hypothetical protein
LDLVSNQAPAKLYNALTMINYIVRTVAPNSTWPADLAALIDRHPTGAMSAMGFPDDWKERPLWR